MRRKPNNLPAPITSFIGRGQEVSEIGRLLTSTRLVTLTGPGGCGKTRLALAVAHHLLKSPAFEQGIWFVDLAGLDAPSLIPHVVTATLGVPEAENRPPADTLADFLQHKKLLLVLDNCEHLLPACAALAQRLLDGCRHVRLLATSREPLNLAHETVWLVPSLSLPDDKQRSQIEHLAKSEAIQLFVARANTVLPDFTLNKANASAVEQICRRLDGIPLAIELAAARIKLLDAAQIAARLQDSLQLLSRGSPSAAPRHQTMRAALDWSYRLLPSREQILFRRLAVFAEGFTLDAVEAVCTEDCRNSLPTDPMDGVFAPDILDLLSDLLDKSLMLIAEREPEQAVRYRLLEPVRQYALDQLRAAGTETDTRDRHLAYFIQFAEEAEQQLKSAGQLLWLTRLEKDHDNLRAALAWGTQHPSQSLAGLRIAKALHLFWQRRGYWSEGRGWLSQALANYKAHPESQSHDADLYFARALVGRSWLAIHEMDYADTPADLERALALAQASDDMVTLVSAQGLLALVNGYTGNAAASYRYASASVDTARRSKDRWALAWALYILGWNAFYHLDNAQAARAALDESEALFRAVGDKRSIAVHVTLLGIMAMDVGALDTARAHYEEALAIGQELKDMDLQVKELLNLACLALLKRNSTQANELFGQVLIYRREWNSTHGVAGCLFGLGQAHIFEGDLDAAEKLLREALTLTLREKQKLPLALILSALCRITAVRGRALEAAHVLGALEANLQLGSWKLVADDRILIEENTAAVRAALAPREFQAAFAAGRALTLEQAIHKVLNPEQATGVQILPVAPATEMLHLCALGATRVSFGEQAVTHWHYARVKELLFYLVSHSSRTKAQIGLALWPDASPAQLRNSLGIGLYHLRRALFNSDWIIFDKDQYCFNRTLNYRFDVEQFEALLAQAVRLQMQTPERATPLLQQALVLYQGDFVEDFLEGEWFVLRREELRRKYLDVLIGLGRNYFAQRDYTRAVQAYQQAIEKDNVLEEAYRELMRSYARVGERGLALRQYQALERAMQDELGSPPGPESMTLYRRLKLGEEV